MVTARRQAQLILPSKLWYYLVMRQRQAFLRLQGARTNEELRGNDRND
jgi:hypothetical protein